MSFNIQLLVTDSDHNVINKNFLDALRSEVSVTIKHNTDLINPTFIISGTSDNIYQYNYLSCPFFNRSYYITNITNKAHNLYEIECHVDVLQSYNSQILNHTAIIERSSTKFDSFLNDTQMQRESYNQVQYKKFDYEFRPETTLLLSVIGGGV